MPQSPLDDLAHALAVPEALLAGVGDRWSDPTPCPGWTVRQLAEHLVGGHRVFADVATGAPLPAVFDPAGVLGDDAVAAHREAGRYLIDTFGAPGALERPVTVFAGTFPGAVAVTLRVVECLVHGWDLARATGADVEVDDDLAARTLAFTERALPGIPTERRPFAPPRPADGGAPALDRLVALLGRDV